MLADLDGTFPKWILEILHGWEDALGSGVQRL
jgi:hypothetical protein